MANEWRSGGELAWKLVFATVRMRGIRDCEKVKGCEVFRVVDISELT